MRHILCYGDSNTWGSSGNEQRLPDEQQWPNILQSLLGADFRVIQEGLCGRIAGDYLSLKPHRNGRSSFEVAFRSASPVYMVIISLGTNDLKIDYKRTAAEIMHDLKWYEAAVQHLLIDNETIEPRVLFVTPANFVSSPGYFRANPELRLELIELMRNAMRIVELPELKMSSDGVHYTAATHQRVAEIVYTEIGSDSL